MKICTKCNKHKEYSEFSEVRKNKNGSILYCARCKDCVNEYYREKYRKLNSEERSTLYFSQKENTTFDERKDYRLKNRFGLSLQQFNKMLIDQNYQCFLCKRPIKDYDAKIDHNHKNMKIRKLLCHNCNTALGLLKEDVGILQDCIKYLNDYI